MSIKSQEGHMRQLALLLTSDLGCIFGETACSARETISFYLAMGCRLTDDPILEAVEAEPFDLQLVCDVEGNSREPVVQPRESVV